MCSSSCRGSWPCRPPNRRRMRSSANAIGYPPRYKYHHVGITIYRDGIAVKLAGPARSICSTPSSLTTWLRRAIGSRDSRLSRRDVVVEAEGVVPIVGGLQLRQPSVVGGAVRGTHPVDGGVVAIDKVQQ